MANNRSKTRHTSQYMDNMSFNDTYLIHENLVYGVDELGNATAIKVSADGSVQTDVAVDLSGTDLNVQTSPTDGFALYAYDDSGTTNYFGYEDADGAWYIKKINDSQVASFVSGSSTNISAEWSNRTTQSYDSYQNVF